MQVIKKKKAGKDRTMGMGVLHFKEAINHNHNLYLIVLIAKFKLKVDMKPIKKKKIPPM